MTEKELQKEAKDRQKEQERMELALRIGKAGIRSSMATTKGALGKPPHDSQRRSD